MGLLVLFGVALAIILFVGTIVLAWRMTHPRRRTYAFAIAHQLPLHPSDLELQAQDVTLRYDDGTQSPAWIIEGARDDGPTAIITHGWSNSRYGTLAKASLYAPYVSRMIVYDVRGHGDSTASFTTLGPSEADDIIALAHQIEREAKPILLVGSSMGAVATLIAAATWSQQSAHPLVGVVLDGPYTRPMQPVAAHLVRDRLPPWPVAWLAHQVLRLSVPGYGRFDGVAAARQVMCPLLVLHGSADDIASPDAGRAIAQAAPRGEMVEFPGAGHGRLWEHDPDRYNDAIRRLMQKVALRQ